jgi:hypothetical protein
VPHSALFGFTCFIWQYKESTTATQVGATSCDVAQDGQDVAHGQNIARLGYNKRRQWEALTAVGGPYKR